MEILITQTTSVRDMHGDGTWRISDAPLQTKKNSVFFLEKSSLLEQI